jgi:ABC-2 type transport system ATP-binding protein
MIQVDGLSKTFYVHRKAPGLRGSIRSLFRRERVPRHAVRNATFQVAEGEIVGVVGANGAGKTTLVKMLAGIIHPTAGDARVLGYRPWERSNHFRRQISLVMGQKAQLWWDLPAADCFLLLKEIYQIPDDVYRDNLAYLTELLQVAGEMNIQIRRLSLGERMKMELIATLLHRPRVVFLDEPTIGLDLMAQRAIRDFLLRYREERRPAMLVTSHYMEDIERLCERILILRDGEIIYDGSLDKVVETYADYKLIVAHLDGTGRAAEPDPELSEIGIWRERTDLVIRMEVPRQDVARAASLILGTYPVADLSIEDVEIGTVIENILRDRTGGRRAGMV